MLSLIFSIALAAAPASGSAHSPEIEAHLSPLVGEWTRAGVEGSYHDSCVWYDRRAFVVCSLTDSRNGARVEAIIGYSEEEQRYTYQNYTNAGTRSMSHGYPLGANGLVFVEERKAEGKAVRLTTSMIPQADGRIRMVQERSVMGGPWQQAGEVFYVRRK